MIKFLKFFAVAVSLGFISLSANEIAFVGDSHFAGKILPNEIAKNLGINEIKIYAKIGRQSKGVPFDVRKEIRESSPKLLIIMFGANDAASNVPSDKYVQEIQKLSNLSDKQVFILVPFYKKDQKLIDEYEQALKTLFRYQNNVEIISTRYCDLKYSKDDVHLTNKGYEDLGKCIAEKIEKREPKIGSLTIQNSYNSSVKVAHDDLIRRKVYVVEIIK